MAQKVRIGGNGDLFVGEDKTLKFNLVDQNGNPIDATGWTTRFVVRTSVTAENALIDVAGSIDGSYSAQNNQQRVVVNLSDEQMAIARGKHQYSLKRTDAGAETILAYGDFVVEQATQT